MFEITEKEMETMKIVMKTLKKPYTKFLPVRFGEYTYNMRVINEAAKKANKRGSATITRVSIDKQGTISIEYRDHGIKGRYQLKPIERWNARYIPIATTTFEIEGVL